MGFEHVHEHPKNGAGSLEFAEDEAIFAQTRLMRKYSRVGIPSGPYRVALPLKYASRTFNSFFGKSLVLQKVLDANCGHWFGY